VAEPVEATPQINPFGKDILKHTLHQFASEFPLCSLNNIVLSLKPLRFKKKFRRKQIKKIPSLMTQEF
jgi:hypothetical protein